MAIRTILDTDIGTDVDDCLAIGFLLGSPEFELEGITCVYGDVQLRGRMVRKLLQLGEREQVPVYLGTTPALLGLKPVYWGGHEGTGLLDGTESNDFPAKHAVDYIIETVMANPGEIHLLAIGPLTNVALAFRKEPRLAQALGHLTIMGGCVRGPRDLGLPVAEHNIACDPDAAQIVLSSGAPMTLVPLDVTTKTQIRTEHVEQIRAAGSPLHLAIADQVERYPRFAEKGRTALHDPLAAAVIVDPTLVEYVDVNVAVETQGRLTTAATVFRAPSEINPKNARLAITVDAPRAEAFIVDRISS